MQDGQLQLSALHKYRDCKEFDTYIQFYFSNQNYVLNVLFKVKLGNVNVSGKGFLFFVALCEEHNDVDPLQVQTTS